MDFKCQELTIVSESSVIYIYTVCADKFERLERLLKCIKCHCLGYTQVVFYIIYSQWADCVNDSRNSAQVIDYSCVRSHSWTGFISA